MSWAPQWLCGHFTSSVVTTLAMSWHHTTVTGAHEQCRNHSSYSASRKATITHSNSATASLLHFVTQINTVSTKLQSALARYKIRGNRFALTPSCTHPTASAGHNPRWNPKQSCRKRSCFSLLVVFETKRVFHRTNQHSPSNFTCAVRVAAFHMTRLSCLKHIRWVEPAEGEGSGKRVDDRLVGVYFKISISLSVTVL